MLLLLVFMEPGVCGVLADTGCCLLPGVSSLDSLSPSFWGVEVEVSASVPDVSNTEVFGVLSSIGTSSTICAPPSSSFSQRSVHSTSSHSIDTSSHVLLPFLGETLPGKASSPPFISASFCLLSAVFTSSNTSFLAKCSSGFSFDAPQDRDGDFSTNFRGLWTFAGLFSLHSVSQPDPVKSMTSLVDEISSSLRTNFSRRLFFVALDLLPVAGTFSASELELTSLSLLIFNGFSFSAECRRSGSLGCFTLELGELGSEVLRFLDTLLLTTGEGITGLQSKGLNGSRPTNTEKQHHNLSCCLVQ